MDIMGSEGFLLTNYQKDMYDFKDPEVDVDRDDWEDEEY